MSQRLDDTFYKRYEEALDGLSDEQVSQVAKLTPSQLAEWVNSPARIRPFLLQQGPADNPEPDESTPLSLSVPAEPPPLQKNPLPSLQEPINLKSAFGDLARYTGVICLIAILGGIIGWFAHPWILSLRYKGINSAIRIWSEKRTWIPWVSGIVALILIVRTTYKITEEKYSRGSSDYALAATKSVGFALALAAIWTFLFSQVISGSISFMLIGVAVATATMLIYTIMDSDYEVSKNPFYIAAPAVMLLFISIIGGVYLLNGGTPVDTTSIRLVPFRRGDKFGFSDVNKRLFIEAAYDEAYPFIDGLAKVKDNGKWGFVDKSGKEVIRPWYDEVDLLSEGLVRVKLNDKIGFMDDMGKELISPRYEEVASFNEGLARVKQSGKYGFMDTSGKEVIHPKYEDAGIFSEGLVQVKQSGGKYGFIDKTDRTVIEFIYDGAHSFSEGLASVRQVTMITPPTPPATPAVGVDGGPAFPIMPAVPIRQDSWGFIDKKGNTVIPFTYDDAGSFSDGLASVCRRSITTTPNTFSFTTSRIPDFTIPTLGGSGPSITRPQTTTSKWGFIDKTGKLVIDFKYGSVSPFKDGQATVYISGIPGPVIDKSGREVLRSFTPPLSAFEAPSKDKLREGLKHENRNGKWGFTDMTGKTVIRFIYEEAASFNEGLARVKLNGKSFYIDKSGTEFYDP